MIDFWSGVGAATVGAVAAMAVPFVAEAIATRARRLASLRAIRSEIRANFDSLRADRHREDPAARLFGTTLLSMTPQTAIKDALASDAALWRDETRDRVLSFYAILYLLRRRTEAHEHAVSNRVLVPPRPSGSLQLRDDEGTVTARRLATDLRDTALAQAPLVIGTLEREIAVVEDWSN